MEKLTKTVYIACDGKEYESEARCLQHEKELEFRSSKVVKTKKMIPCLSSFIDMTYDSIGDPYILTLYNVETLEDLTHIKAEHGLIDKRDINNRIFGFEEAFNENGAGPYIYYETNWEMSRDSALFHLIPLNDYNTKLGLLVMDYNREIISQMMSQKTLD